MSRRSDPRPVPPDGPRVTPIQFVGPARLAEIWLRLQADLATGSREAEKRALFALRYGRGPDAFGRKPIFTD